MRACAVFSCVCAVILLGVAHGPQAVAAPCSSYTTFTPVFCDDFDEYCSPPPEPGEICESGATPDDAAFHTVWPADGTCDPASLEDFLVGVNVQGVFGSQCVQRRADHIDGGYDRIYRHVHDLVPDIAAHPANTIEATAINGAGPIDVPLTTSNTVPPDYVDSMSRTLRPQALKGTFYFQPLIAPNPWGRAAFANMVYYHELFLDSDRAPTDYTIVECPYFHDCTCNYLHPGTPGCGTGEQPACDGGMHDGQICSSDDDCTGTTRPVLKPTDGQVHASFAIGLMAILDGNNMAVTGASSNDACDLDQGWYPSEWRMVVYDGLNWHTFKAPSFGLPLTSPPDMADFYPLYEWNRIDFAIGADYIEVRLTNIQSQAQYTGEGICVFGTCRGGSRHGWGCDCPAGVCVSNGTSYVCEGGKNDGLPCNPSNNCTSGASLLPNEYWVARVPRQYSGPFNRYALGPGKGRDVTDPQNPGPFECLELFSDADVVSDEIVLYDGVFPAGACCLPNGGCADNKSENQCATLQGIFRGVGSVCGADPNNAAICKGACCKMLSACEENKKINECTGGTFSGPGTTCAQGCPCPDPFADVDRDGDVDQLDFAVFQGCFSGSGGTVTGGCKCFDRHPIPYPDAGADNDVDRDDLAKFELCASGPGIPMDPACDTQ